MNLQEHWISVCTFSQLSVRRVVHKHVRTGLSKLLGHSKWTHWSCEMQMEVGTLPNSLSEELQFYSTVHTKRSFNSGRRGGGSFDSTLPFCGGVGQSTGTQNRAEVRESVSQTKRKAGGVRHRTAQRCFLETSVFTRHWIGSGGLNGISHKEGFTNFLLNTSHWVFGVLRVIYM